MRKTLFCRRPSASLAFLIASFLLATAEENKPSVIGEFHFSRYPDSEWRKELVKMKAGAWIFKQASGKIRAARHGEKVNYVFVDGHVEARRPEEILEKNIFRFY